MNTPTAMMLDTSSDSETRRSITEHDRVVVFNDLVDSTPLLVTLGDEAFADLLDLLDAERVRLLDVHGGRLVNLAGDGALMTFETIDDAISFARDFNHLCEALAIRSRTGIHRGDVRVRANGDLAGLAVNIAARIEAAAPAGGVVASAAAVRASDAPFVSIGARQLKGVPEPTELYELVSLDLEIAA